MPRNVKIDIHTPAMKKKENLLTHKKKNTPLSIPALDVEVGVPVTAIVLDVRSLPAKSSRRVSVAPGSPIEEPGSIFVISFNSKRLPKSIS